MLSGVSSSNIQNSMGFLDAFNHVSRHSLRTSGLCTMKSSRDFSMIGIAVFGGPFIGAVFQNSFKMAAVGVGITGGYICAKYIHKSLEEGRPLNSLLERISKIDMPLFLGGHIYMSGVYINDFVTMFTGKIIDNSIAEPTLLIGSVWAAYSAWPKLKPFPPSSQKLSALPPAPK